jgi:outer membrane protein assembly factor BamB
MRGRTGARPPSAWLLGLTVTVTLALGSGGLSPATASDRVGSTTSPASTDGGFVAPPTVTRDDRSTTFQLNAAHDGAQDSDALVGDLEERWRRQILLQGYATWVKAAAVAGDTVIVTGGVHNTMIGRHSVVTGLDLHTGEILWGPRVVQSGWTTAASATIVDDTAYVLHSRGTLLALDLRTGRQRWRVEGVGDLNNPAIVVGDALVYGNNAVEVRDQRDGRLRWRSFREGLDTEAPPASDGETLYVAAGSGHAQALGLDGTVRWDRVGDGYTFGYLAPVLHDGRLYVRERSTAGYVLDARDGRVLERFSSYFAPAFRSGVGLFTPFTPFSPMDPCCEVEAVDLATGDVRWTSGGDALLVAAPIVVGDTAWVATQAAELRGLDLRTGEVRQVFDLGAIAAHQDEHNGAGTRPGVVAGEGFLLVPTLADELIAFAATGPGPSLSADEVRFVTSPPGQRSSPATVTLTNTGGQPLTVERAAIAGSAAGSFELVDGCRGRVLATGERCELVVRARPDGSGLRTATVRLATSAGPVSADLSVRAQPLRDVVDGVFLEDVYWALDRGVTRGCEDGRAFCPRAQVTRAQMASFLARALHLPPAERQPFGDVTGGPHADAVARVAAAGVTRGCGDGRAFCPDQPVTRAQMASFLARGLALASGSHRFRDVSGPHADAIGAVAAAGIARGCGDGTRYCPEEPVRRDQMVAFLHRALER